MSPMITHVCCLEITFQAIEKEKDEQKHFKLEGQSDSTAGRMSALHATDLNFIPNTSYSPPSSSRSDY